MTTYSDHSVGGATLRAYRRDGSVVSTVRIDGGATGSQRDAAADAARRYASTGQCAATTCSAELEAARREVLELIAASRLAGLTGHETLTAIERGVQIATVQAFADDLHPERALARIDARVWEARRQPAPRAPISVVLERGAEGAAHLPDDPQIEAIADEVYQGRREPLAQPRKQDGDSCRGSCQTGADCGARGTAAHAQSQTRFQGVPGPVEGR